MNFDAIKSAAKGYEADMTKFLATIIDTLNHDDTISTLLDPVKRIHTLVEKHKAELGGQIQMSFED